jgi:hypothetical protein
VPFQTLSTSHIHHRPGPSLLCTGKQITGYRIPRNSSCILLCNSAMNLTLGSVSGFLPTIIKGLGYTNADAQFVMVNLTHVPKSNNFAGCSPSLHMPLLS